MSRNGSGSYSLPSGNPVVQGTTITSTWANALTADIATEMTDSLSRSGKGGMSAPLALADGTAALPGLTFSNDPNTGMYRAGADDARVACGGADVGRWTSAGYAVTGSVTASGVYKASDGAMGAPVYTFTNEPTSGLYRAGAGDLRLAVLGAEVLKLLASGSKVTGALEVTGAVTSGTIAATGAAGEVGLTAAGGAGQAGASLANGTAATGATRQTAAALTNGDLSLAGVANPDKTVAHTNVLGPKNVPKAWAVITTDGAGGATLVEGFNVASVAVVAGNVLVTMAAAMASANYSVNVTTSGVVLATLALLAKARVDSASAFTISALTVTTAPSVVVTDFAVTSGVPLYVLVFGPQ